MRVGAELNSSTCRLVSRCTGDVSCSTDQHVQGQGEGTMITANKTEGSDRDKGWC
jgi:hypothetical protein